ncbi:hypothetical protein [Actinokineospora bangkokensis]|nr:hypothetical protein [Actinokineospora bangkokensis]
MRARQLRTSRLLTSRLLGEVGHAEHDAELVLGEAGGPAEVPTLVVVIVDDSGSVTSTSGSDPQSNRYQEIRQAFRAVARAGAGDERAVVLHFDVQRRARTHRLNTVGLWSLEAQLSVPHGAGSSQLGPSLGQAERLVQRFHRHRSSVVLFSDFALADDDPAAALARFASLPGRHRAVVLGSGQPELPEGIAVSRITEDSTPGAVARTVFGELVAHRPGSIAYVD